MPHNKPSKLLQPPSRPLDVHRWSDYPELNDCLSGLVAEIERYEARVRARSSGAATRLRNAVRCIILDLYVAWSADPNYEIGVSLGKDSFGGGTRYDALFLRYDAFHPAYSGLTTLGYVHIARPGFHDPRTGIGRVTRIRATEKLIKLLTEAGHLTLAKVSYRAGKDARELIELRDADKEAIDYTDTKLTIKMRADLERINAALASHWLDLRIPDTEMTALNARMASDYRKDDREAPHVELAAKQLRRVFNNGDWAQGGRFYGGWWQTVPKEYRVHITINDKPTTEVDYTGMHPALLYAEAGAKLDGEAYDIGVPSVPRDVIKRAFNKLVNASGRTKPTPNYDAVNYGLSWTALLKVIRARHEPIAMFLGTGYGVRLQNKDATIANRIMLRFLDKGYLCLPVHDSFIVHEGLEDSLKAVMSDEFRTHAKADIGNKSKKIAITNANAALKPVALDNDAALADFFNPTGEYAGYETRLNNWWLARG